MQEWLTAAARGTMMQVEKRREGLSWSSIFPRPDG